MGSGTNYKYVVIPSDTKDFKVSRTGLITASLNPVNYGWAGEIWVIDRFGDDVEIVQVYMN
ncbi:hypothetical protein D3C76_1758750 [compost metagenome]